MTASQNAIMNYFTTDLTKLLSLQRQVARKLADLLHISSHMRKVAQLAPFSPNLTTLNSLVAPPTERVLTYSIARGGHFEQCTCKMMMMLMMMNVTDTLSF